MKEYSTDFADAQKPEFIPNPANSTIRENIIVSQGTKSIGIINKAVYRFSPDIKNNLLLTKLQMDNVFTDAQSGNYSIKDIDNLQKKIPGFEEIPIDKIGIKTVQ